MSRLAVGVLLLSLMLSACGSKTDDKKNDVKKGGPTATPVTVAPVETGSMQMLEESVGVLESFADPVIAAEIAGKVLEVKAGAGEAFKAGQVLAVLDAQDAGLSRQAAQAEVRRVQTLYDNQARNVARQRQLREKNFISQAVLDDTQAQLNVLQSQLGSAKAQLAISERSVGKTRIVAPFDGRVEKQIAVRGQYVKVGDPLFQVVAAGKLRARLPFPESMAARLTPGMQVSLSTFIDDRIVTGKIDSIRPMTGLSSRSFEAIVVVGDPGLWRPGSTVTGQVVMGEHLNVFTVPQHSVVLRPAGKVVYVLEGDKVRQRPVTVGILRDGKAEIVSGLTGSEQVVVDGAGFLTDQAPVNVAGQTPAAPQAASAPVAAH